MDPLKISYRPISLMHPNREVKIIFHFNHGTTEELIILWDPICGHYNYTPFPEGALIEVPWNNFLIGYLPQPLATQAFNLILFHSKVIYLRALSILIAVTSFFDSRDCFFLFFMIPIFFYPHCSAIAFAGPGNVLLRIVGSLLSEYHLGIL